MRKFKGITGDLGVVLGLVAQETLAEVERRFSYRIPKEQKDDVVEEVLMPERVNRIIRGEEAGGDKEGTEE